LPSKARRAAALICLTLAAGCGGSREEPPVGHAASPEPAKAAPAAPEPSKPAPPAPPPPSKVPSFRRPDAKAQKTTPSGLCYEVLAEGTGAAPAETESFEMEYTFWTREGDLLESSTSTGACIQGRKADMGLAFLKEAPTLLKEGGEAIFEVPADLAFGKRAVGKIRAGEPTIWRLRLVRVGRARPDPAFVLPAEADLKRSASGLGVQVLRPGAGEPPRMGDRVVVHYAGWLADSRPGEAKPFDSSFGRGLPATFRLGEVIQGWNEGLQSLRPGGEAILVIPADLGYGARGAGDRIPPKAALVFRVELLEVKR